MQTRAKFKTSMCRHYQEKGYCSLYENCYFAHSPEELRSEADPLPNNLPTPMKPISNFKTQLCKFFQRGYCKNKDDCTYAHGQDDIRSMPIVPADSYAAKTHIMAPTPPRVAPTIVGQPPVYPMYMVPIVPIPVMNHNMQLITIIQNLYQVFPGNLQIQKDLRKAEELAYRGDAAQASQVLKSIVNDGGHTEAEKQKVKIIIQNAVHLNSIRNSGGYMYQGGPAHYRQ